MSIKTAILHGMKKSRRKYHTTYQLDRFVMDNQPMHGFVEYHSVRARISELNASGQIHRVAPNKYTLVPLNEQYLNVLSGAHDHA